MLQVRMSSTRLPGKAMAIVDNCTLLEKQISRIMSSKYGDTLIVLTSTDTEDDVIENFCHKIGVKVFRGSPKDVLERFISCLDRFPCCYFVRITGDCPLISPSVINEVIENALVHQVDYYSNNLVPTYPDGLDVEVVKSGALLKLQKYSLDDFEKEHVTFGIYTRQSEFTCINHYNSVDLSSMRWTVDNADDLEFVKQVYEIVGRKNPKFDYEDVLKLINSGEISNRTEQHYPRNKAVLEYLSRKVD